MSISTLVGMGLQGRLGFVRRKGRSVNETIVAALLALAVIASLFLVFSDSVRLLRVGLVVALWAATLGSIAMTKYRRESVLDRAKVKDLQVVYELQLEREIAARREYELTVESRVRREVRADAEELAALRAELTSLRQHLEVLFDGSLPIDQVALKTDAGRIQELAGGYQPAASGLYIPGSQSQAPARSSLRPPTPATPDPFAVSTSLASGTPTLASPFDDPITAETTVVPESEAAETESGTGAHSSGLSVAELLARIQSSSPVGAEPVAGAGPHAD